MTDAYHALYELWASPEYQEKSAKKRKSGAASGTHLFGGDGYVRMGQRVINPHIYIFITIYTMICY
jgi:hypothetical protein